MKETATGRLSPFELAVCQEYFKNGLNKSAAFRTCHRAASRWKDGTLWNRASELFALPHVQAYVDEMHAKAREIADKKLEITVERVLQEFARIAFGDVRRIFNDAGQLIAPVNLDDNTAAAISSIEVVTRTIGSGEDMEVEYVHKIKFHDKMRGLENLARYLHIFELAVEEDNQGDARFKGLKVPSWMRELIPAAGD